ncbi:MAG: phosphoribosyltransferase [Cyclobacteriaceae bacterium]
MIYKDRSEAAFLLAEKLRKYRGKDGVVVAIPRGGLPVGYVLARYLDFPLDIALTKKIGHPSNKEYAIGSVSLEGRIIGEEVAPEYIEAETARLREALCERYQLYRRDRSPIDLRSKIVIVTDDGIATGNTMLATIELVKAQEPLKVVIAVPVAPPSTIDYMKGKVDEMICLQTPEGFGAVGQFYENFESVSDDEAVALLERAKAGKEKQL